MKHSHTRRGIGKRVNSMAEIGTIVTEVTPKPAEPLTIQSGHPDEAPGRKIELFVQSIMDAVKDDINEIEHKMLSAVLLKQVTEAIMVEGKSLDNLNDERRESMIADIRKDFPKTETGPMEKLSAKMADAVMGVIEETLAAPVPQIVPEPVPATDRPMPNKSIGESDLSEGAQLLMRNGDQSHRDAAIAATLLNSCPPPKAVTGYESQAPKESKMSELSRLYTPASAPTPAPASIADMIRAQANATREQLAAGLPDPVFAAFKETKMNHPDSVEAEFMNVYGRLPELEEPCLRDIRKFSIPDLTQNCGQFRNVIMGDKEQGHVFIYSTHGESRYIAMRGLGIEDLVVYEYLTTDGLAGRVRLYISDNNVGFMVRDHGECSRIFYNEPDEHKRFNAVREYLLTAEGLQAALRILGGITQDHLADDKKSFRDHKIALLFKKAEKSED